MKYFRNTELAKIYKVSEKSVRNWIEAAQSGKIELQLFEHNGKYFIANTSKNTTIIEKLVEKGKKFRNTRGHKKLVLVKNFTNFSMPKKFSTLSQTLISIGRFHINTAILMKVLPIGIYTRIS